MGGHVTEKLREQLNPYASHGYSAARALATPATANPGPVEPRSRDTNPARMTQTVWADKHCEGLVTSSMENSCRYLRLATNQA